MSSSADAEDDNTDSLSNSESKIKKEVDEDAQDSTKIESSPAAKLRREG